MEVLDSSVKVSLDEGRTHYVQVLPHADGWTLVGASADAATLKLAGLTPSELWSRNRHLTLVGYSIGIHGDASVTAWVPDAGTTAEEFSLVMREVAIEADRLEFYCTGEDVR
jgi:hypothetical protein